MIVTFLPLTKREKQLQKEHGLVWIEVRREPVPCFQGRIGSYIRSPDRRHERWIEASRIQEAA